MRTFHFVPKECQDQPSPDGVIPKIFEGHIDLRVPSYPERMSVIDKGTYMVNAAGEIEEIKSPMLRAMKFLELTKDFVQHVSLKRVDDGTELKSFEDMTHDPDCDAIIRDLAGMIQKGFRPSKN